MAELPDSLLKALDSLEKSEETKDSKNCALSLRVLHGLRNKVSLETLASLFKSQYHINVK